MAKGRPSPEPLEQLRRQLELCWQDDCDIDHLILRARQLRCWGRWRQAHALEQEVLPLVCSQSASAWFTTRRSTSIRASSAAV